MPTRDVEFGLIVSTCASSWQADITWATVAEYAKKAESLGFDSIWVMDHYWNPYLLDYYTFEALTTLAALSEVVHRVRLGTCVLCNTVRHPSNLATTIASIDAISNGRLNIGIGSGWGGNEAKMLGIPWPNYQTRLEMLEESLQVLGSLLTGKESNFEGKHYSLKNARIGPPPIQEPHPPLWVGGTSKAVQEIIAHYGDAWLPEAVSSQVLRDGASNIRTKANGFGRDTEAIRIGWCGGAQRGIIESNQQTVEKEAEVIFKTNWWGKPV